MIDKTIVNPQGNSSPAEDDGLGATLRTVRVIEGQNPIDLSQTLRTQTGEQSLAESDNSFFKLKGVSYRNLECLSDNSGEAQVFLVEHDEKPFVLKVYYPNFDINKKMLQVIRSFDFEMIVKIYDFG